MDAVLVAANTPYSDLPMPALITDPEQMTAARPLAPAAPFNAARQASAVLRQKTGKRIALVLRPCEVRALIELAKLNQCSLDNALLISFECAGRMENADFLEQVKQDPAFFEKFNLMADPSTLICPSCRACTHFAPTGADIVFNLISVPADQYIGISAGTEAGRDLIEKLKIGAEDAIRPQDERMAELKSKRQAEKEALAARVSDETGRMEKFQHYFAHCLNCSNCRVACPVCYCRECVFVTEAFDYPPEILFRRAEKKGMIKLPQDTSMFHLTRMAHMAHACVGCGQCSSACPSHIPVADVFIAVGQQVQELYGYEPGRDLAEKIPLLDFGAVSEKQKQDIHH